MIYNYQLNYSMEKANNLDLTWQEHYVVSFIVNFFHSGNADKKVVNNRTYYWLTYSLICKRCAPLRVGLERMRQVMNNLCNIGVLKKLETNSTKKYYSINYNTIMETDEDIVIVPGVDASLSYYLNRDKSANHFSTIKFNSKIFTYFTPAIDNKIILRNLLTFEKNLYIKIKRLLSPKVFKYFKDSTFEIKANEVTVSHIAPLGLIKDNYYKLERAVVDTYISTAYSATAPPTTPNKPIEHNANLREFSKLFENINIDCELNSNYNLTLLTEKVKESSYLKQFTRLSDLLRKYNLIIKDKYKDFSKNKSLQGSKKPNKRRYTSDQLESLMSNLA